VSYESFVETSTLIVTIASMVTIASIYSSDDDNPTADHPWAVGAVVAMPVQILLRLVLVN
jgi:hypothetical protein